MVTRAATDVENTWSLGQHHKGSIYNWTSFVDTMVYIYTILTRGVMPNLLQMLHSTCIIILVSYGVFLIKKKTSVIIGLATAISPS